MTDLRDTATWREIHAQPGIWADWAQALPVADLRAWVAALGPREVWFCGAGSSAYVGEIAAAALEGQGRFRAVATTDIVARPRAYLGGGARPLVVSFGRSGNSAETIGLLDALDALAPDAPRLNITCNAAGALATRLAPTDPAPTDPAPTRNAPAGSAPVGSAPTRSAPTGPAPADPTAADPTSADLAPTGPAPTGPAPTAAHPPDGGTGAGSAQIAKGACRAVILPAATHDAGFAMTSSFTTMLLTALAIFSELGTAPLPGMAQALTRLLPVYAEAAGPVPERAVFVGSGPLACAARECALKVMELTAGRVPALWDTTLGFRHGPKSFVRGATLICVLTHPDPHTARYDADLVAELRRQYPAARVMAVGPGGDIDVGMADAGYGAALVVPLAQLMAVIWSAALGLHVDDPFQGQGTLSRVVSGVTLYPVRP